MRLKCFLEGHYWSLWFPWANWKLDRIPSPEYVAGTKQFRYCLTCNKAEVK